MTYYAGIDVSLEYSSVCVVDGAGKIMREQKIASEPEALIAWFRGLGFGLEGSAWRLALCRNGFMRRCGRQVLQLSSWRRGTCATLSTRCRSRATAMTRAGLRN